MLSAYKNKLFDAAYSIGLLLGVITCPVAAAAPPPDPCVVSEYPLAARRYEIEGKNSVGILVDGNGTVLEKRLVKSSGSAILDNGVMAAMKECSKVHFLGPQTKEPAWKTISYEWKLAPRSGNDFPASVMPKTCAPNDALKIFDGEAAPGVVTLRFRLGLLGGVTGIIIDQSSGDAEFDKSAASYIDTCKYKAGATMLSAGMVRVRRR